MAAGAGGAGSSPAVGLPSRPPLRPSLKLLGMHLTSLLPEASLCPISWGLINSSPPHRVRKQVCAEPGPGPERGLSAPLVGLGGRGEWRGARSPSPPPSQGRRQGRPLSPSTPRLSPPVPEPRDRGDQECKTQLVLSIIFIKGGRQPASTLSQAGPWVSGCQGQRRSGPQPLSAPSRGRGLGPGLGWGESQPPQGW